MINQDDPYIAGLKNEKRSLETRISELQAEVRMINNLIYRRKTEAFAQETNEKVNLKNVDRLFFETLIRDTLTESKHGLRTGEIQDRIAKHGYNLNYNTLRSYVAKMRDKGLIKKKSAHSYHWIASD